jgi:hypothetical protein
MIGKGVVFALVLALLGMCLVDVVHAAMPSETPMDCATLLCNGVTGCEPTSPVTLHVVVPIAIVPAMVTPGAPSAPAVLIVVAQSSPISKHHIRPSAPRSPPLV